MTKFRVHCCYKTYGEAIVEAETSEEAAELVEMEEIDIEECGIDGIEVYDIEEVQEETRIKLVK